MTFRLDERKLIVQLYTGKIQPHYNKVKQYFLPYLLDSPEEIQGFLIKNNDMYIGDGDYLYIHIETEGLDDDQITDLIIDMFQAFKQKGEFSHTEIGGEHYVGIKPDSDMVTAFREGRYSEMYDNADLRMVFSEHAMLMIFEGINRKYGIGSARRIYFYLKKAIYTLTKDRKYEAFLRAEIVNIPESELDSAPEPKDKENKVELENFI